MSIDFCLSCHGDAMWADTSGWNRLWGLVFTSPCIHVPTYTHPHTQIQMYSTVPSENGGASVGEVKRLSGSSTSTGLSWRSCGVKIQLSTLTGDWMDSPTQFVGRRGLANHTNTVHICGGVTALWDEKGKDVETTCQAFRICTHRSFVVSCTESQVLNFERQSSIQIQPCFSRHFEFSTLP